VGSQHPRSFCYSLVLCISIPHFLLSLKVKGIVNRAFPQLQASWAKMFTGNFFLPTYLNAQEYFGTFLELTLFSYEASVICSLQVHPCHSHSWACSGSLGQPPTQLLTAGPSCVCLGGTGDLESFSVAPVFQCSLKEVNVLFLGALGPPVWCPEESGVHLSKTWHLYMELFLTPIG
jgi:hypothetical protein